MFERRITVPFRGHLVDDGDEIKGDEADPIEWLDVPGLVADSGMTVDANYFTRRVEMDFDTGEATIAVQSESSTLVNAVADLIEALPDKRAAGAALAEKLEREELKRADNPLPDAAINARARQRRDKAAAMPTASPAAMKKLRDDPRTGRGKAIMR